MRLDGVELDAISEPLLSGLGLSCMESCRRVQVTVPSTWTRKECICISFAWAAWRRTSRRAARLQIARDAGMPGEREATIRSDGLGIAASKREVFIFILFSSVTDLYIIITVEKACRQSANARR